MPKNIKGDAAKMQEAAELAYAKAEEMLSWIDYSKYQKKVFVGKSIGTVVMSKYIQEHHLSPKQIWYTPVEATFSFPADKVIAFLGDADPWSDVEMLKQKAADANMPLYLYPNCNHSLETDDVDKNLEILRDVMLKTAEFVK
jgi:phosphoglycolate phosphatase